MRGRALAAVSMLVLASGCGGADAGSPPTADTRGPSDWLARAGAACEQAEQRLARRREPAGVRAVGRFATGAAGDLRRLERNLERIGAGAATAREPIEPIRVDLAAVTSAAGNLEPTGLRDGARGLSASVGAWERTLEGDCAGRRWSQIVVDPLLAPIYRFTWTLHEDELTRSLRRAHRSSGARAQAARRAAAYRRHADRMRREVPPSGAERAAVTFTRSVAAHGGALRDFARHPSVRAAVRVRAAQVRARRSFDALASALR